MRFSEGEMVFHRLQIRSKATNVAEIESKSNRGNVKTPKVVIREAVRHLWSSPQMGIPRLDFDWVFLMLIRRKCKSVRCSNVM